MAEIVGLPPCKFSTKEREMGVPVLFIQTITQGYIGALEIEPNRVILPDTKAILNDNGLDMHIVQDSKFIPSEAEREIVRITLDMVRVIRTNREAGL